MRSAFHYIVEFAVILLGITVSVMIEKNNAREYKENIKNQSLERILSNIRTDSVDFEFNISVHSTRRPVLHAGSLIGATTWKRSTPTLWASIAPCASWGRPSSWTTKKSTAPCRTQA